MDNTEINKKIGLFNLDTKTINYCDSWDALIPVYQSLANKAESIQDDNLSLYILNCLDITLNFYTMTTQQFALGLCLVIDEYYSVTL
jgi:hypothetical protein